MFPVKRILTSMKPIQFLLAKITEAYCVENNIPIKRQFTHEELEASIEQIRQADRFLYGQPPAAEACTDPDFSTTKGVEP